MVNQGLCLEFGQERKIANSMVSLAFSNFMAFVELLKELDIMTKRNLITISGLLTFICLALPSNVYAQGGGASGVSQSSPGGHHHMGPIRRMHQKMRRRRQRRKERRMQRREARRQALHGQGHAQGQAPSNTSAGAISTPSGPSH